MLKSTIRVACLNPNSIFCSNVKEAERLNVGYSNISLNIDSELQCKAQSVRDLVDIRDGVKHCDLFNSTELCEIIDSLCLT